ncbi:MAG TPA: DedA family protein [Polyangiaceae bacterium]
MSFIHLFQRYGYWLVLGGTLLEGETVLIMAGFAAHQGYLVLPWVMLVAFIGSFSGDQLMFFLGRYFGERILARFQRFQNAVDRVHALLDRRGTLLMLGFRFVYGLRNTTPFVIGMSALSARRFSPLNAIGAAVWAVLISALGFVFGQAVEAVLHKTRRVEERALLVLVCGAVIVFGIRHLWGRKGGARRDSQA